MLIIDRILCYPVLFWREVREKPVTEDSGLISLQVAEQDKK